MCLDLVNGMGTRFTARLDGLRLPIDDLLGGTYIGVLVDTFQVGQVRVNFGAVANIKIAEDERGPLLEGVIVQQGFVEPSSSVPVNAFADAFAKEVGASYQIIGDGSGRLLQSAARP
jgi:hypothetical protein